LDLLFLLQELLETYTWKEDGFLKRWGSSFQNLSVTWKFIIAYFSVLIVPVLFIGIYLYNQTSNSAISQAQMLMEQNLLQTKESILQKMKIIENISQIITFDNKIQTFLENGFTNDAYQIEDYQYNILPFVENISRQNPNIYSIRIYMTNPTIPELYNSFYKVDRINQQSWYKEVISKPVYGWRTVHDAATPLEKQRQGKPVEVFSFYRKISSIQSFDMVGLLEIEVKEDVLFDVSKDPMTNKLGKVFLMDNSGTIVSNNIPDAVKQQINVPNLTKHPQPIKRNEVDKVDGIKSIVISIPIDEIGASVMGIFPVDSFNEKVKSSLHTIIMVLSSSLLLLGIVIYMITNKLLKRIKKLVKAMKQVREGSLDVSVPIKSNDEFTQLALNFNHMTGRIHDLVETVYKIQILEREAELKALEAQVNPHFLYNTLATISWVARKANAPEIVEISNSLAKFYRLVLSKGQTLIFIKDEIEMLKAYLHIQKFRFESMFDVLFQVDESIYAYKIVKNILQPLVENALTHGIEPKRGHGTIQIKAGMNENNLVFQIIDDGVGIDGDTLAAIQTGHVIRTSGSGYALGNIMARLKAIYGDRHSFDVYSKSGIGTVITIKVGLNETITGGTLYAENADR
jgi:two-component system sensor histidine kinase YesM